MNTDENARPVRAGRTKGNFNIQGFVDVRTVAGVHIALSAMKVLPEQPRMGDLVRTAFELLARVLERNGRLTRIPTNAAAIEVLRLVGYSMAQLGAPGGRRLAQALTEEALRLDFDPTEWDEIETDIEELKRRIEDV